MLEKTVSVVIPFYNNVDWLIEAVESVLNQTYKAFEIIVINDGSKEDMTEFLNKYGSEIIYIYKENEGPAIARNRGVEVSKGDYIAFLDSDDIWTLTKLEVQLSHMIESKSVWSHTSYYRFNNGETLIDQKNIRNNSYFSGRIYPLLLAHCPIATPCVMIQGDVLRNNPDFRFNPKMRYGQDWSLWINIAILYPIEVIHEPLTLVRMRGTNAALRARIQITSKSIIWELIKKRPVFYSANSLPKILQTAFKLSSFSNRSIKVIEGNTSKEKVIEFLSKVLYLPAWVLFKMYSIKTIKKSIRSNNEVAQ